MENSQWCWTLVIHHYIYWEPLEILETDMKGGNHCQNEKIVALVDPQCWIHITKVFFLIFTPGLSYFHIVVVANNIWLVRFFHKEETLVVLWGAGNILFRLSQETHLGSNETIVTRPSPLSLFNNLIFLGWFFWGGGREKVIFRKSTTKFGQHGLWSEWVN